MSISVSEFCSRVIASRLMSSEEIRSFVETGNRDSRQDARSFAKNLIREKRLTKYQVEVLWRDAKEPLVLGNYTILETLGKGGMGVVFKAEHRHMKRNVAIKTISPAIVASTEARKRFEREVQAAARLVHGNIVTAFDADVSDGVHFLVMEFVDGKTLDVVVRENGPLPLETAVDYVMQAAQGLDYAHATGVIHRDIKPSNLMVDRQGNVKILDMGLAKLRSDMPHSAMESTVIGLTGSGATVGTADYVSPEQALDGRMADARSDLYSLGCTLFFLLTGRPLFDEDTAMKKLLAHRDTNPPKLAGLRADLPAALCDIYARLVAKDPDKRYQSARELIVALSQMKTTEKLPQIESHSVRRRQFLIWGAGAAAAVTAGTSAVLLWKGSPGNSRRAPAEKTPPESHDLAEKASSKDAKVTSRKPSENIPSSPARAKDAPRNAVASPAEINLVTEFRPKSVVDGRPEDVTAENDVLSLNSSVGEHQHWINFQNVRGHNLTFRAHLRIGDSKTKGHVKIVFMANPQFYLIVAGAPAKRWIEFDVSQPGRQQMLVEKVAFGAFDNKFAELEVALSDGNVSCRIDGQEFLQTARPTEHDAYLALAAQGWHCEFRSPRVQVFPSA